jgi:hypothetical protein
MKKIGIVSMLLFFIFQTGANAQQKFEKESRLKPADVPKVARQFIDAVEMDSNWKWYFEENLEGNSVEAKTKYKGRKYSVEFDVSGNVQDIEIEKNWQELDDDLRRNIAKSIDSLFFRHKINKVQIQYSAEKTVLLAILNNKTNHNESKIQYEIVVAGKKNGRPKLYELTFTGKGELLKSSEIILRNTDNLEN